MNVQDVVNEIANNGQIRAALVSAIAGGFADVRGRCPIFINTPGLMPRSIPYAKPLDFSFQQAFAAFGRAQQYNPVDRLLSAAVTGPGAMVLGLPGAPGVATGPDRSALYTAMLLDVSLSNNVPPQPFTFDVVGTYEDGSPYLVNSTEYGWSSNPSANEQILVIVTEETAQGPRQRTGRLTTADWPTQFLANGAPTAVADMLTMNITAAPASMGFNLAAITAGHALNDVLAGLMLAAVGQQTGNLGPAATVPAGALQGQRPAR